MEIEIVILEDGKKFQTFNLPLILTRMILRVHARKIYIHSKQGRSVLIKDNRNYEIVKVKAHTHTHTHQHTYKHTKARLLITFEVMVFLMM